MISRNTFNILWILLLYTLSLGNDNFHELSKDFITGTPDIQSMSTLAFGPEGILFIGDSRSATIFALDLNDKVAPDSLNGIEIKNIEAKLGDRLGCSADEIMIHHMAVNPISKNVYLALSIGENKNLWNNRFNVPNDYDDAQLLIRISPDNSIAEVKLENIRYSSQKIFNFPGEDSRFFRAPGINYTITDIEYEDGRLFASGLGNEDFQSIFRSMEFPFNEEAVNTPIETFHIVHNRMETYAPALTFVPTTLNGEKMILAIYYCTPLVLLPQSSLKASERVTGRTIAELGSGSRVTEIIKYTLHEEEYFLIAGNNKSFIKIKKEDIETYEGQFQQLSQEEQADLSKGVKYKVGEFFAQQLDNYDEENILILNRKPNGTLDMTTVSKRWL